MTYLIQWDNGERSLIIVDEKPYFLKQIDITEEHIKTVGTAIDMGIPSEDPDQKEMSDFWNKVLSSYLTECIHRITGSYSTTEQNYMYWKQPWFEKDRFDRQFALARKHANELNRYRKSGDFVDIYSIVRAVEQLLYRGALFQFRKLKNNTVKYSFSMLLQSIENYYDTTSKVIILDGTANLSVEYLVYKDYLDIRPCDKYRRDLSKLNINVLRAPTGKTRLKYDFDLRDNLLGRINEYQSIIQKQTGEQPVIFSYKFLRKNYYTFCDEHHYDWFGNIKGKNDYRQVHNIIQVGLNVYPLESYFLFELAKHPELLLELQGMQYEDTIRIIRQHIDDPDGFTKEAALRELLAELEQNIFRGTIRNSNNLDDYTFHLFISQMHEDLIKRMEERYAPLNAHVSPAIMFSGFNSKSSSSIFARAVRWHDTALDEGDSYTIPEMAKGINETREAVTYAAKPKSNKLFDRLLLSELEGEKKPGRTAIYIKRSNWSTD